MPLNEDRIRALEGRTEIPPGAVVGSKLGWMGVDSEGFDVVQWTPDPDAQLLLGHGDPNTNVVAEKGFLYVDRDVPTLWQNSDGDDTWIQVGSGSGFPVGPEDDGTATHEVAVGSGLLTASSTNDADPTKRGDVVTVGGTNPGAFIRGQDGSSGAAVFATVIGGLSQVQINVDGTIVLQVTSNEFRFNGPDPMQIFIGGAGGCGIGVYLGDPNGVVAANQGSLVLDLSGAAPWYNTDGATAWTQLT